MPVRVERVVRAPIGLDFETNGTLEAENDVDLVARTAGPIVALSAEEGQRVARGAVLARIDDSEIRAQLAVGEVRLHETKSALARVESLFANDLVSRDERDTAKAAYETALGDVERTRIQVDLTTIRAPFGGQIAARYVRHAEYVTSGTPLFRIADFDTLLCPIQVPERQLSRLAVGQPARLGLEAWPDQQFEARVLRISPVVDSDTGTIRVTLEVDGEGRLRPGMFASVFLELERRDNALVIPKRALALDSLGDAVFVAVDGVARRRAVVLGFESTDHLEVVEGLEEGDAVVVVGQDGLSDETPVEVLEVAGHATPPTVDVRGGRPGGVSPEPAGTVPADRPSAGAGPGGPAGRPPGDGPRAGGRPGGGPGGPFAIDWNDAEQVERVKERMRSRGLTEAEIDERLARLRERSGGGPRGR